MNNWLSGRYEVGAVEDDGSCTRIYTSHVLFFWLVVLPLIVGILALVGHLLHLGIGLWWLGLALPPAYPLFVFWILMILLGVVCNARTVIVDPDKIGVYQWLGDKVIFKSCPVVLLFRAQMVIIPCGQEEMRSARNYPEKDGLLRMEGADLRRSSVFPMVISSLVRQDKDVVVRLPGSGETVVPADKQVIIVRAFFRLAGHRIPKTCYIAWYDDFKHDRTPGWMDALWAVKQQVFGMIASSMDEVLQGHDMKELTSSVREINAELQKKVEVKLHKIGVDLINIMIDDEEDMLGVEGYMFQRSRQARLLRKKEIDVAAAEYERETRTAQAEKRLEAIKSEQRARKTAAKVTFRAGVSVLELERQTAIIALQATKERIATFATSEARRAILLERLDRLSPDQMTAVMTELAKSLNFKTEGGDVTLVGMGDFVKAYPVTALLAAIEPILDKYAGLGANRASSVLTN